MTPPPALPCSLAESAPQSLTRPFPLFLPGFECLKNPTSGRLLPAPADLLCFFPELELELGRPQASPGPEIEIKLFRPPALALALALTLTPYLQPPDLRSHMRCE